MAKARKQNRSSENEAASSSAAALLRAHHYEDASALLDETQNASLKNGDELPGHLLLAVRRLCQLSSRCQAEAEWHSRAASEARRREQELNDELCEILSLISDPVVHNPTEAGDGLTRASKGKPRPAEPHSEALAGLKHLLQRSLVRLRQRLGPRSPNRAYSGLHDVASSPPPPGNSGPHSEATRSSHPSESDPPPGMGQKLDQTVTPTLVVHCLGPFHVYIDGRLVEDWPSCKGKAILKYLVAQHEHSAPKEVLMELLWPGASPHAAHNNLNVAIHGLRKALSQVHPSFSHVVYRDDCYSLNPRLELWIDAEAFLQCFHAAAALEAQGESSGAIRKYREAEKLYDGEFLEEERYEDWVNPVRQNLEQIYLTVLGRLRDLYLARQEYEACVDAYRKILEIDRCDEEAHRGLMQCFRLRGQTGLALRQYRFCAEVLQREFELPPSPPTQELFEKIREKNHS